MPLVRPLLAAALALAVAAPVASAQEPAPPPPPPQEQRIAPGVFAGGVDLSNMTIEEAAAALAPLRTALEKPVIVAVAGRRFTLRPRRAKMKYDPLRTAKRAYYAGRDDPPTPSQAGGTGSRLDVPLAVEIRRAPVRDFATAAAKRVYLAPRNATLRITLRRMIKRRAKIGRRLDVNALRKTLEATLVDIARPRLIKPGRKQVRPPINANDLARIHRTVVTVDKSSFRLRLFKRLKLSKSYGIAHGTPAYPTPSGLFRITSKAVNPTWTAPNSPWAGELAGQQVAGGAPNNPLKARWMGIVNGVGIHGTGQEWSIGSRASHGCIRMRVRDVIDLYPRVPVGTRVLIR